MIRVVTLDRRKLLLPCLLLLSELLLKFLAAECVLIEVTVGLARFGVFFGIIELIYHVYPSCLLYLPFFAAQTLQPFCVGHMAKTIVLEIEYNAKRFTIFFSTNILTVEYNLELFNIEFSMWVEKEQIVIDSGQSACPCP